MAEGTCFALRRLSGNFGHSGLALALALSKLANHVSSVLRKLKDFIESRVLPNRGLISTETKESSRKGGGPRHERRDAGDRNDT